MDKKQQPKKNSPTQQKGPQQNQKPGQPMSNNKNPQKKPGQM